MKQEQTAILVSKALMDEVCTTPKPGLVDRANSGSHRDMDIFTFTASIAALFPYWNRCVQIGWETAERAPEDTFRRLKRAGLEAERDMFAATGGVNTHKGAIFTLGAICGSVGRLWDAGAVCRAPEAILDVCAGMVSANVSADLAALCPENAHTAGERLYLSCGMTGVRGEAAQGFPGISGTALPVLRRMLDAGYSRNDAGVVTLLHLIARGTDTNMAARGGAAQAQAAAEQCRKLLERACVPDMDEVRQIDRSFIQKNLSPGGCADLLATSFFLHDLEKIPSDP